MYSRNYQATVKDPTKNPLPMTRDERHTLYVQEQLSLPQIATQLGCSRQRVARWIQFWGIARRSGADSTRIVLQRKTGSRSPNWQGGSYYIKPLKPWFTWAPGHPRAKENGAVATHILVAEQRIGRPLRDDEVVHHLDEDRHNNAPDNLCVMSRRLHMRIHRLLGHIGTELINAGYLSIVLHNITDRQMRTIIRRIYHEKEACIPT